MPPLCLKLFGAISVSGIIWPLLEPSSQCPSMLLPISLQSAQALPSEPSQEQPPARETWPVSFCTCLHSDGASLDIFSPGTVSTDRSLPHSSPYYSNYFLHVLQKLFMNSCVYLHVSLYLHSKSVRDCVHVTVCYRTSF